MSNPPLLQTGSQLIRSSLRRGQPEGGDARKHTAQGATTALYAPESADEGIYPVSTKSGLTPQEGEKMQPITYTQRSDYLLPDIVLSDPPDAPPLGKYGMKRLAFLKEHRPALYASLLLSERLYPHLRETDEAAAHRLATIADRNQVEEIINELIYE